VSLKRAVTDTYCFWDIRLQSLPSKFSTTHTCHHSTEFCEHRLINVCAILLTNKQGNAGANITSLADVSNHVNSSNNIISSNHANGTRSKANSLHKGLPQKQQYAAWEKPVIQRHNKSNYRPIMLWMVTQLSATHIDQKSAFENKITKILMGMVI